MEFEGVPNCGLRRADLANESGAIFLLRDSFTCHDCHDGSAMFIACETQLSQHTVYTYSNLSSKATLGPNSRSVAHRQKIYTPFDTRYASTQQEIHGLPFDLNDCSSSGTKHLYLSSLKCIVGEYSMGNLPFRLHVQHQSSYTVSLSSNQLRFPRKT